MSMGVSLFGVDPLGRVVEHRPDDIGLLEQDRVVWTGPVTPVPLKA